MVIFKAFFKKEAQLAFICRTYIFSGCGNWWKQHWRGYRGSFNDSEKCECFCPVFNSGILLLELFSISGLLGNKIPRSYGFTLFLYSVVSQTDTAQLAYVRCFLELYCYNGKSDKIRGYFGNIKRVDFGFITVYLVCELRTALFPCGDKSS